MVGHSFGNEEKKMHFISEYVGDNDRTAIIAQDEKGFLVELYKGNELVETRTVYEHSEAYAEDLAENWCQGII